jgi:hypothetical protein
VQQAMQQMGQQMDALTQELHASADKLQELQEGAEYKLKELTVKAYQAETQRMQALSTGMTAEDVSLLVQQTLQQLLVTPAPSQAIYEDIAEAEQEEQSNLGQPMAPQQQTGEPTFSGP